MQVTNGITFSGGYQFTPYVPTGFLGNYTFTLNNPNAYSTPQDDVFGFSVSVSNSYILSGAYGEDAANGSASGKAYLFNLSDGSLKYTFSNPNIYSTGTNDIFGYAVAVSESYAIVGAHGEDAASGTDQGAAYVYSTQTGNLLYSIADPNITQVSGTPFDIFGRAVAINETYAAVAAPQEQQPGGVANWSGRVYVYNLSNGSLRYSIMNPVSTSEYRYGLSLAMSENHMIVGVPQELTFNGGVVVQAGKVYIYNVHTGTQLYAISPNIAYQRFGHSVAISNTRAVVGTELTNTVYVYSTANGSLLYSINNPNPVGTNDDNFGHSVAVNDDYILVSAYNEDEANSNNSGKVYLFSAATGNLVTTYDNKNDYGTSADDNFGYAVSLSNTAFVVGAYNEDQANNTASGKVYVYK